MQSRSRMHLLFQSDLLPELDIHKMDTQSMPSGPGIDSQKGMKQYSHVLYHTPNKIPEEVWMSLRVRGTEDVFHDLLILAAFLRMCENTSRSSDLSAMHY